MPIPFAGAYSSRFCRPSARASLRRASARRAPPSSTEPRVERLSANIPWVSWYGTSPARRSLVSFRRGAALFLRDGDTAVTYCGNTNATGFANRYCPAGAPRYFARSPPAGAAATGQKLTGWA